MQFPYLLVQRQCRAVKLTNFCLCVGAYQIHLDARPLRHPKTKEMVRIPLSKPNLATALAIEWDHLTSAQQATKQHLIPLASLVCRAIDIKAADDAQLAKRDAGRDSTTISPTRHAIVTTTLRYLDTDSLLCWAPPQASTTFSTRRGSRCGTCSAAQPTTSCLSSSATHGRASSSAPCWTARASCRSSSCRACATSWARGWWGLDEWDLAGSSAPCWPARASWPRRGWWSNGPTALMGSCWTAIREAAEADARLGEERFGAAEMARATNVEVDWQTGRWGEVEDTHDVEKEDLRRQFGGVVLLVSGTNGHKWRSGEAGTEVRSCKQVHVHRHARRLRMPSAF